MEKIKTPEIGLDYPKQLDQLTNFITEEILPNNVKDKFIGGWYPSYVLNPEESVKLLFNTFKKLSPNIGYSKKERPNFIECGSGLGMVGAIASIAGFNVYNFEIDNETHHKAVGYIDQLEKKEIIKKNTVNCINGSYYLPNLFKSYKEQFLESRNITPTSDSKKIIATLLDLRSLNQESEYTYNTIIDKIEEIQKKTEVWNDLNILDHDYLEAQIVFSYPSDIFFKHGFFDQMSYILRPNSYLILNSSSQVTKALESHQINSFDFTVIKKPSNYQNLLILRKT